MTFLNSDELAPVFDANRALALRAGPVSRPGASRIDHGEGDRVWNTVHRRPLRPFGSALPAKTDGRIESPSLITERPRKLRGSPPCPECGNRGPYHCECEVE